MNNNNLGVLHGSSLPEKIAPRHDPGSFFRCLWWDGGSPPAPFHLPLLPFYSSFLPPEWGPWGRYLSHQPLPLVVGSGCKDREVWLCQAQGTECYNGSLSLRHFRFLRCPFLLQCFSLSFFCFSAFPTLWNDMECHYQWQVTSFILDYIHTEEDSPYGRGGAFPSHDRGGVISLGWAPGPVQTSTWAYQSFTPLPPHKLFYNIFTKCSNNKFLLIFIYAHHLYHFFTH